MKKKIITILSTSVILSTFISALTLNANTELSSQNSCKDFQKFILTKGYDYNYKYDLNSNGKINVLDLCRQKKYELIKNNITTTTTTPLTTTTTTPITTTITTTTQVTTTTKPQTTTTVTTTTAPVTTTVQTTPVDTSSWGLSLEDIQGAVSYINEIRAKKGLYEYKTDLRLCNIANIKSGELQRDFTANRPDGSSYKTLYNEYGIVYSIKAYIIMECYGSYKSAIDEAMNYTYLTSDSYKYVGIGKNGFMWTIFFGG
jgi:uncharacterized protein YkwD